MNNASAFFLPVYRRRRPVHDGGMGCVAIGSAGCVRGGVGRGGIAAGLALALGLAAALSAGAARAQPVQGLYMSGGLGLSFRAPDAGTTLPPADPPPSARSFAPAPTPAPLPTGQAALGYGFADSGVPLRLELQGVFMNGRTGP